MFSCRRLQPAAAKSTDTDHKTGRRRNTPLTGVTWKHPILIGPVPWTKGLEVYDEALNLSGFLTTQVITQTGKFGVRYSKNRVLSRTTGVCRDAQSLLPVEYWSMAKATMDIALKQFINKHLQQFPKTSFSWSASVFVNSSDICDSDSCIDDGDIDLIDYIPLHDLIHNPNASRSPCHAPPAHIPTQDIC